jgi:hypothetical protein
MNRDSCGNSLFAYGRAVPFFLSLTLVRYINNSLSFGRTKGPGIMKKLAYLRQLILQLIDIGWLNKYTVSAGLFIVWMLFFDKHNFFTQWNLRSSVSELESSIEDYQEQLAEAEAAHQDLMNNKEKFAREKYLMHRPDEDVFIFQ